MWGRQIVDRGMNWVGYIWLGNRFFRKNRLNLRSLILEIFRYVFNYYYRLFIKFVIFECYSFLNKDE